MPKKRVERGTWPLETLLVNDQDVHTIDQMNESSVPQNETEDENIESKLHGEDLRPTPLRRGEAEERHENTHVPTASKPRMELEHD